MRTTFQVSGFRFRVSVSRFQAYALLLSFALAQLALGSLCNAATTSQRVSRPPSSLLLFPHSTNWNIQPSVKNLRYPKLGEVKIPSVVRALLPNGLKLIMVEDHELPQVEFRAVVRGGRLAEPKDKAGLAELFGSVHRTGGVKSMTGDQMDEALEKIGASLETSVGEATFTVSGRSLTENVDQVLPLFAELLMSPVFSADKVALAKMHLSSAIARRNDDPTDIGFREFHKLIYGKDSPYARQYEYEDLARLTREDLVTCYSQYFRPDATILGVWGDFSADAMKAKITELLGVWNNTGSALEIAQPIIPNQVKSVNYVEKKEIEQTFLVLGHVSLTLRDPDAPAVRLLSQILGNGMSSRIYIKVREEKGLAYVAGGAIAPAFDHAGALYLYASTKPTTTHETLSVILQEVEKIRQTPVTEEELRRAKEGYLNTYAYEFDSTSKVVNRLMNYEFYGYPQDFNLQFRKAVEKVTREDLLRVARKHLHPEDLTLVAVGNAARFDKSLSLFGTVTTLDITIPKPGVSKRSGS